MPSPAPRPEPPYRRIVEEIRGRILTGDLRPGDRIPSVRQVAQRWGVAVATATRAMAALRDDGLVEATVGSGTVVSRHPSRRRPAAPPRASAPKQPLSRKHVLRAAMTIADVEGL